MPETITSPTVTQTSTATPSAPVESTVTTATPTSDAATGVQSAPESDTFTKVDPSKLPPELKSAYDNMLRDYKKKTQEIAESRKQFESVSKKAEYYDQISSDPAFVDYWNGLSNNQKAQAIQDVAEESNLKISNEEFSQAFESPENFMKLVEKVADQKVAGLQKKVQATESELVVTKASEFLKDFKSREEYKDFEKYDRNGFITYQIQLNPPEKADPRLWERSLKAAYENAKRVYQEIYEEGRKEALTRIEQKALNSTEAPSNSASNIYSGGDPKKLSAAEAVALARKNIRVRG